MMKINISNILLAGIIVLLLFNMFNNNKKIVVPEVKVVIPEVSGSTGEVKLVDSFIPVEVPRPYKVTETIQVDKGYKELYEKAMKENDSLKQYNLFLESIKITEKDITLVDNDTLKASIKTKNRGELLSYNFDWKLKEQEFSYKPKIITQDPKLALGIGFELALPNEAGSNFALKGNLDIYNKKGDVFSISPDTDRRIWLGYTKKFTLIK